MTCSPQPLGLRSICRKLIMRKVMNISKVESVAALDDAMKALDSNDVNGEAKNTVLGILYSLKSEVVRLWKLALDNPFAAGISLPGEPMLIEKASGDDSLVSRLPVLPNRLLQSLQMHLPLKCDGGKAQRYPPQIAPFVEAMVNREYL